MDYSQIYPFWQYMTPEQKQLVQTAVYSVQQQKGEQMHRASGSCQGLMTVLEGQLRTYILSEEGREVTLFRVSSGEVCVLSASCLMDAIDFDVTIEAMQPTRLLVLPLTCLNSILQENPRVELYLYKTAAERFSDVMWTMQQILFRKTDQRVAAFLWDEMSATGSQDIALTHDEIARCIGSAREVVTKTLKYLAQVGAVELHRGRTRIADKEKLRSLL